MISSGATSTARLGPNWQDGSLFCGGFRGGAQFGVGVGQGGLDDELARLAAELFGGPHHGGPSVLVFLLEGGGEHGKAGLFALGGGLCGGGNFLARTRLGDRVEQEQARFARRLL